jgi:hypothetical protein
MTSRIFSFVEFKQISGQETVKWFTIRVDFGDGAPFSLGRGTTDAPQSHAASTPHVSGRIKHMK